VQTWRKVDESNARCSSRCPGFQDQLLAIQQYLPRWRRLEDDLRTLLASGFDLERDRLSKKGHPVAPYTPKVATIPTQLAIQHDSPATVAVYREPQENPSPKVPVVGRIGNEAATLPEHPRSLTSETKQSTQARDSRPIVDLLRSVLRKSPKKFKDLYPIIAERYPEHCPAQGTKVNLASMAWLNRLQNDLRQIAINLDGVWQLTEDAGSSSQPAVLQTSRSAQKLRHTIRKSDSAASTEKRKRQKFPYPEVANLWNEGKTISEIAHAIGRIDINNPRDPYHSLRNFLRIMHKFGYVDETGRRVKLPHRVAQRTIDRATAAGQQGGAHRRTKSGSHEGGENP